MVGELARRGAAIVAVVVAAGAVAATSPRTGYFVPLARSSKTLEVGLFAGEPKTYEVRLRTTEDRFEAFDRLTAGVVVTATVVEALPAAPEQGLGIRVMLQPIDRPENWHYRHSPGDLPSERDPEDLFLASGVDVGCCQASFRLELSPVDLDFARVELRFDAEFAGFVGPEEEEPSDLDAEGLMFIDLLSIE